MPRGRLGRTPKSLKISGEKATRVKRVANAEGNGPLPMPGPGRPKGSRNKFSAIGSRAVAKQTMLPRRASRKSMGVCGEPQNDVAVTLAPAAHPHESRGYKINGLRVRGVLHGLNALLDWLKCRSEHGCGQLGNALAIADSGFDPFLDQPLL
jgi:hypothetical protein